MVFTYADGVELFVVHDIDLNEFVDFFGGQTKGFVALLEVKIRGAGVQAGTGLRVGTIEEIDRDAVFYDAVKALAHFIDCGLIQTAFRIVVDLPDLFAGVADIRDHEFILENRKALIFTFAVRIGVRSIALHVAVPQIRAVSNGRRSVARTRRAAQRKHALLIDCIVGADILVELDIVGNVIYFPFGGRILPALEGDDDQIFLRADEFDINGVKRNVAGLAQERTVSTLLLIVQAAAAAGRGRLCCGGFRQCVYEGRL